MDTSAQLYESEAAGWKRGLYEDAKATFRAPVVNWIFRTLMANDPALTRYLWGQVKPVFETRAFAEASVAYRDAVLSAVEREIGGGIPTLRYADLGVSPAEFAECRGQLATFDVVIPRLAVFFEVVHRSLSGGVVGDTPDERRAATEPMPPRFDADRGRPPTMVDAEDVPAELDGVVDEIRAFHGFESNLPSVYRCLAQWPDALEPLWEALDPRLNSEAFDDACADAGAVVSDYVEHLPYRPRLSPADLDAVGADADAVADLFERFARGPVKTVLPAVPLFAAAVDVAGRRNGL